jgi:hypothetical protein
MKREQWKSDGFFTAMARICLALGYNDVRLGTCYSDILPNQVDIRTHFSRNIFGNIPIISAPMDTVTEAEMAIEQTHSEQANLQEADPSLRKAQTQALRSLQQAGQTGMTSATQAALNKASRDSARDVQAKQQQIQQQLQAQGIANSGQAMLQQQLGAQQAANQMAEEQDRVAAMASQQALQSMQQAGQLGGNIRGQDYDIASSRAKAADELNRFNVSSRRDVQARNVGQRNLAQQANLQNKQNIMDKNISMANQEKQRQVDEQGKFWDRKFSQASGQAQADRSYAQYKEQEGAREAQAASAPFTAVASGVGTYYGLGKTKKEDEDK